MFMVKSLNVQLFMVKSQLSFLAICLLYLIKYT